MNNCNRKQYENTSVVLPGIRRVQIDSETVSSPTIANVTVITADSEVSYALPSGTVKYKIRARNTAKLKLSYTSGESGTVYQTIFPGCVMWEEGLDSSTDFTLYFQTPTAGTVVEIISWA